MFREKKGIVLGTLESLDHSISMNQTLQHKCIGSKLAL